MVMTEYISQKRLTAPKEMTAVSPDLVSEFLEFAQVGKNSNATYLKGLKNFMTFCNEREISTPTHYDVLAYKAHLENTYKPNTVNLYLTSVKVFYNWLEVYHNSANVTKGVKRVKVEKGFKKDYLTSAECKAVLAQINTNTIKGARDFAILALMLCCGLRCVEVTRLTQSNLVKSGDCYHLYIQGKGHAEADDFVVLPAEVKQAIDNYNHKRPANECQPLAPLFASVSNNNHGGPLTVCAISGIVKQSFKNVGLDSDRLTAHSTRHTAITLALIGGATVQQAQQLARHSNINTTLIYSHNLEKSANPCTGIVANEIF